MKFTATIHPPLLETLGPKQKCESKLLKLVQITFWATTRPINREQNITVDQVSQTRVDVCLYLNQRDAEIVKDMIHETLYRYFDPKYVTDINVEINTEL